MNKTIIAAGLVMLTAGVHAQSPVDGAHYIPGSHGIKGGSLPGPGFYLEDDNLYYFGSLTRVASSGPLPGGGFPVPVNNNATAEIYQQSLQATWVTPWQFLGADYGANLEIPIEYRHVGNTFAQLTSPGGGYVAPPPSDDRSGLADVAIEPLILGWHWMHFDTTIGYTLWMPTGKYNAGRLANLGDDEWSSMVSLGGVWYPDEKKTWAVSLLHHYEFNGSQTGIASSGVSPGGGFPILNYYKIPCSTYTAEWAVSKTFGDYFNAGVFGYYQKVFTTGSPGSNFYYGAEIAGVGPEISVTIPKWDLTASLRYACEFTAYDRVEGHTINLSLSKRF